MSNTSQGPGWWLASDGKWYPPELHPDASVTIQNAEKMGGSSAPQGPGWWEASDRRWYPPEAHPDYGTPSRLPPSPTWPASSAPPTPPDSLPSAFPISGRPLGGCYPWPPPQTQWYSPPWSQAWASPQPTVRNHRTVAIVVIVCVILLGSIGALGAVAFTATVNHLRIPIASAQHVAPIAIPPSLYVTASAGAPSLVTPAVATTVASSMWSLRQLALSEGNTDAIQQLDVPRGPLLASDLTACGCSSDNAPLTYSSMVTLVPVEPSYPLDFMAEYQSTTELQPSFSGGNSYLGPWEVIEVLTKDDMTDSWRVAFATGFSNVNASANVVPFRAPPGAGLYDNVPTIQPPVPTDQLPGLLAAYWQSFKDTGKAPHDTPFLSGTDSSDFGAYLAQTPQGTAVTNTHSRVTFAYSADPSEDGIWSFPVQPGDDLVTCSTVRVVATYVPDGSSVLVQGANRVFGAGLAPGRYSSIEDTTIHETCIVTASDGLAVFGTEGYDISDTGSMVPGG